MSYLFGNIFKGQNLSVSINARYIPTQKLSDSLG